jgi:hypothetical protein
MLQMNELKQTNIHLGFLEDFLELGGDCPSLPPTGDMSIMVTLSHFVNVNTTTISK